MLAANELGTRRCLRGWAGSALPLDSGLLCKLSRGVFKTKISMESEIWVALQELFPAIQVYFI